MVAKLITQEMVDKLEESLMMRRATPARLIERAETALAWVNDSDAFELAPEVEKAYVLTLAAEDLQEAGESERALAAARQARAAAAPGRWVAHNALIRAHLASGDLESAKAVAEEARKAAAADPMVADMIGSSFELGGELALAERWYSIGLRTAGSGHDDFMHEMLLRDRHRVRRDQDKPLDGFDEEFEALNGE